MRKNILGKWELHSSLFPFILFSFQRKKNKCKFFTGWTKFQMNSGSILWKKVNHKSKTDLLPTKKISWGGIFKLREARAMPQNKWPKIILSFLISNLNFYDQVTWLGLDFLIGLCWPDISQCNSNKPENAGGAKELTTITAFKRGKKAKCLWNNALRTYYKGVLSCGVFSTQEFIFWRLISFKR